MESSVFEVNPGDKFVVSIGAGGVGAGQGNSIDLEGNTDGGDSLFGNLLLAKGGKTPKENYVGGDGGSGGSAGCSGISTWGLNGGSDGTVEINAYRIEVELGRVASA